MGGKRRKPSWNYKHRVMPKQLQLYKFKKLFYKLNPEYDADVLEIGDTIDSEMSYTENFSLVKEDFREYKWDIEKTKKRNFRRFYKDYCKRKPLNWEKLTVDAIRKLKTIRESS